MGLAAGIAGLAGTFISSRASGRAADQQAASADAAIAETRRAEEAATARLDPFTKAGASQINPLLDLVGTGDPTFERTQGFEDIQQSAAAGGKLRSGGTLRDLTEFNAGVNERFRGNRFNELLSLVNLGRESAAGTANIGTSASRNVSSLLTGKGDVTASGTVGRANAISTGINELGSFLGTLKKPIATQPVPA